MKIHYISCHSVLEYDEVQLFTDLGHDVFSNGAYLHPEGAYTLPRPAIKGAQYHKEYADIASITPKTALPDSLIKPFDVIVIMHSPEVLFQNWQSFKRLGKRVIWRTIGQSVATIEHRVKALKEEGLEIVRYSPKERNLANYAGEDAMIRFYKDPEEFKGWTGDDRIVVNFSQSLKGRRDFCHYDEITQVMEGFDARIYGTGNDDLGALNGGEVPYDMQKRILRRSRVMMYGGTWPASYTLSLMEAMMTGTPVVAIGAGLANIPRFEQFDFYEVPDFIESGVNGFCHDDIASLRNAVSALMTDLALAKKISENARKTAIELFGKETIGKQWQEYLEK